MKPIFFTIVSANYLAYAITLMRSVATHHPEARRVVVLVDRIVDGVEWPHDLFELITVEDLKLPARQQFLFRYTIMELNTAVKPYAFQLLRNRFGPADIVYLDPDILVVGPLRMVVEALNGGASIVLTPHLTGPLEDECLPNELSILRVGAYNLGFIAVGCGNASQNFIAWWCRKLEHGAYVNLQAGLFTDQKWVDLVPGMFPDVMILRDPGYNLAYWNLPHRPVQATDGQLFAGGSRIRFVHFSGIDPKRPNLFSKHQNRLTVADIGPLRSLYEEYLHQLECNGYARYSTIPYAYNYFNDGTLVSSISRSLISRELADRGCGDDYDPYSYNVSHLDDPSPDLEALEDAPQVSRIMFEVWRVRADLRAAFDLRSVEGRESLCRWFIATAHVEMQIPKRHADAASATFDAWLAAKSAPKANSGPATRVGRLQARVAAWVLRVHQRLRASEGTLALLQLVSPAIKRPIKRMLMATAGHRFIYRANSTLIDTSLEPAASTARGALEGCIRPANDAHEDFTGWDMGRPRSSAPSHPSANLVGYVRGEFGVAECVRTYAKAAIKGGIEFSLVNIDVDVACRTEDRSLEKLISTSNPYPVNVLFANADQMPVVRGLFGESFFAGRYNVGYWFWELSHFPDAWMGSLDLVDEIWVASRFVENCVRRRTSKPVRRLSQAVEVLLDRQYRKGEFGLADDRFEFLCSFDFNSYIERKNPAGAIAAFRQAFPMGTEPVSFTIKSINGSRHPSKLRWLLDCASVDARIRVVDSEISRPAMMGLLSVIDCYVSLHRSEGLGLGLAESMFLGKPVVATNYSGNTDFMTPDNSALVAYDLVPVGEGEYPHAVGQVWARPDVEHAAQLMSRLVDDHDYRQAIANKAALDIRHTMSLERCAKSLRSALMAVGRPGL